jgi:hypothetical protein
MGASIPTIMNNSAKARKIGIAYRFMFEKIRVVRLFSDKAFPLFFCATRDITFLIKFRVVGGGAGTKYENPIRLFFAA